MGWDSFLDSVGDLGGTIAELEIKKRYDRGGDNNTTYQRQPQTVAPNTVAPAGQPTGLPAPMFAAGNFDVAGTKIPKIAVYGVGGLITLIIVLKAIQ